MHSTQQTPANPTSSYIKYYVSVYLGALGICHSLMERVETGGGGYVSKPKAGKTTICKYRSF